MNARAELAENRGRWGFRCEERDEPRAAKEKEKASGEAMSEQVEKWKSGGCSGAKDEKAR